MAIIVISEDLHSERAGMYRAFSTDSLDAGSMCPLIGYCSPGGSYRTVREAVASARRIDKVTPIYRQSRGARGGRLLDAGHAAHTSHTAATFAAGAL